MVEVAAGHRRRRSPVGGEERVPVVADGDGAAQRRQAGDDLVLHRPAIVVGAAVVVPVDGEQHHGLDLTEAVEDAGRAEVGARRGEDRTDRDGAEHGDHRLDAVRQPRRDPVALAHAHRPEGGGHGADLLGQPVPADRPGAVLVDGDHRQARARVPQHVLGDAQLGIREEAGLEHRGTALEHHLAGFADHATRLPHGPPEGVGLVDRPPVEVLVGLVAGALEERGETGPGDPIRGRGPQRCHGPIVGRRHPRWFRAAFPCPWGVSRVPERVGERVRWGRGCGWRRPAAAAAPRGWRWTRRAAGGSRAPRPPCGASPSPNRSPCGRSRCPSRRPA